MMALSQLAFAVAYRRVGVVVLKDGQLRHWQIASAAYDTDDNMEAFVLELVREHQPDVVVTELLDGKCRKGTITQARIAVIGTAIAGSPVWHIEASRRHRFQNKYEEAEALAIRYPDLKPWVVAREKCWDNEPRNTVLFEALSMADAVMRCQ